MVRQSVARKLGSAYSTRTWFIEYKGVLSNHLAHGVVALEHLGASDARIEDFADKYVRGTPLREATEARAQEAKEGLPPILDFDHDLVGARTRFYALHDFYARQVEERGRDAVIRSYLNRLLPGLCGALLHNMIHLGYGYRAQVDQIAVEGLAYMHHSYLPLANPHTKGAETRPESAVTTSFAEFETSFLQAYDRLRREAKISGLLAQHAHEADDWSNSVPQNKLRLVSLHGIDALNELSRDLPRVPSMSWYVDLVIRVVVETTRSRAGENRARYDFVLLHGATCSWALHQVEHLVDAAFAQRCLANTLFAVLAVQGCPPLGSCPHGQDARDASWEDLCVALRNKDLDEHAYKLGAVAHERALSSDANYSSALYKQAAQIVTHLGSTLEPFKPTASKL